MLDECDEMRHAMLCVLAERLKALKAMPYAELAQLPPDLRDKGWYSLEAFKVTQQVRRFDSDELYVVVHVHEIVLGRTGSVVSDGFYKCARGIVRPLRRRGSSSYGRSRGSGEATSSL